MFNKLLGFVSPYVWYIVGTVIAGLALTVAIQSAVLSSRAKKLDALRETVGEWRSAATQNAALAARWAKAAGEVQGRLDHAVRENLRVDRDAQNALATARRERDEANAVARHFTTKFNARSSSCDAALKQMEAACPALQDY
jgi:hypothetical protein